MNPLRTRALTRQQIGQFVTSERGVRAFEDAQSDITGQYDALSGASFLTLGNDPALGAERALTPVSGDLVGADGGENAAYTLGLADTAVTPGTYGSAAGLVTVTIDRKGRVTGATTYTIGAGAGLDYSSGTGVFSAHSAGAYGAPTGTLSRTAFASYTAGTTLTYSAAYVQAEQTATGARLALVEIALQNVSRTLAALITDLKANGNLT